MIGYLTPSKQVQTCIKLQHAVLPFCYAPFPKLQLHFIFPVIASYKNRYHVLTWGGPDVDSLFKSCISSSSSCGLFCPATCPLSGIAAVGVLAPLTVLGGGTGDAEDGTLSRAGAFAGLPELVFFIPVAIIGGLATEVVFARF